MYRSDLRIGDFKGATLKIRIFPKIFEIFEISKRPWKIAYRMTQEPCIYDLPYLRNQA